MTASSIRASPGASARRRPKKRPDKQRHGGGQRGKPDQRPAAEQAVGEREGQHREQTGRDPALPIPRRCEILAPVSVAHEAFRTRTRPKISENGSVIRCRDGGGIAKRLARNREIANRHD